MSGKTEPKDDALAIKGIGCHAGDGTGESQEKS